MQLLAILDGHCCTEITIQINRSSVQLVNLGIPIIAQHQRILVDIHTGKIGIIRHLRNVADNGLAGTILDRYVGLATVSCLDKGIGLLQVVIVIQLIIQKQSTCLEINSIICIIANSFRVLDLAGHAQAPGKDLSRIGF